MTSRRSSPPRRPGNRPRGHREPSHHHGHRHASASADRAHHGDACGECRPPEHHRRTRPGSRWRRPGTPRRHHWTRRPPSPRAPGGAPPNQQQPDDDGSASRPGRLGQRSTRRTHPRPRHPLPGHRRRFGNRSRAHPHHPPSHVHRPGDERRSAPPEERRSRRCPADAGGPDWGRGPGTAARQPEDEEPPAPPHACPPARTRRREPRTRRGPPPRSPHPRPAAHPHPLQGLRRARWSTQAQTSPTPHHRTHRPEQGRCGTQRLEPPRERRRPQPPCGDDEAGSGPYPSRCPRRPKPPDRPRHPGRCRRRRHRPRRRPSRAARQRAPEPGQRQRQ